jgi:hypothetical protein
MLLPVVVLATPTMRIFIHRYTLSHVFLYLIIIIFKILNLIQVTVMICAKFCLLRFEATDKKTTIFLLNS